MRMNPKNIQDNFARRGQEKFSKSIESQYFPSAKDRDNTNLRKGEFYVEMLEHPGFHHVNNFICVANREVCETLGIGVGDLAAVTNCHGELWQNCNVVCLKMIPFGMIDATKLEMNRFARESLGVEVGDVVSMRLHKTKKQFEDEGLLHEIRQRLKEQDSDFEIKLGQIIRDETIDEQGNVKEGHK